MFDTSDRSGTCLTDARIVTPHAVVHGSLTIADGRIAALGPADAAGVGLDGDYLIPGLVDLHTDHVETHVFPRRGVSWSPVAALAAHDGVVISGGVTTVFDSLCVGACMPNSARRDLLLPLVDALEAGREEGLFRADHLLHLRCEIGDPDTDALVDQTIGSPIVRLVSVMDHTPGDRQCLNVEDWIAETARDFKVSHETATEMTNDLIDRAARFGPDIRARVIAAARAGNIAVMSHDDRTSAHVDDANAMGVTVSEFPTTVEAATRAREVGQAIVAGAPNFVRGGSQSGNVAVRDLLRQGLVDVLASDYVPGSLLAAAFGIAEDPGLDIDLPAALAMVSANPARIGGLEDRGQIVPGLAADLVRVRQSRGHAHVMAVWRGGRRVF
ncbi:MAG: alpha-D-ribose 1-methylphosphonate 5-triphosphate diphosphatase [Marinibacterium sp.]